MLWTPFNYVKSALSGIGTAIGIGSDDVSLDRVRDDITTEKINEDAQILKGIGVLYEADEEICSISRELEFRKSDFFGLFKQANNNDEVIFEARKPSGEKNWTVTAVQVHKDSAAEKEKRRQQIYVVIVDKIDRVAGEIFVKGGLDKERRQVISRSLVDFDPNIGDYLRLYMKYDGIVVLEGDFVPQRTDFGAPTHAEPTKQMQSKGTVTISKNSYLCIDMKIYFEGNVVESHRQLQVGDEVAVTAIESLQKPFSWRAVHVKLVRSGQRGARRRANCSWEEEEDRRIEEASPVEELFKTHRGISIFPEKCLKFRDTCVSDISSAKITISVAADESFILRNVTVCGDQNICAFDWIVLGENEETDEYVANLKRGSKLIIEIFCQPQMLGLTKDLIKFEFDKFVCARFLEVFALPLPEQEDVEELLADAAGPSNGARNRNTMSDKALIDKIQRDSLQELIKGKAPFRAAFFQCRRLPYYIVPDDLWRAVQHHDNNIMLRNYGFAVDPLSSVNFVQKFDLCLWFEEIAELMQLQTLDINVKMRRAGPCLVVPIPEHPTLADKLNCGGKVTVKFPGPEKEEWYEGWIKEVKSTDVFICVNEKLHIKYYNETVKVELKPARTNYRRNHFAVESAMQYLGVSFLFPTLEQLAVKPCRTIFEDDVDGDSEVNGPDSERKVLFNSHRVKRLTETNHGTLESRWNTRAKSLRPVVANFDEEETKPNGTLLKWVDKRLNEEQKNAVRRILRGQGRPLPYIIYGPPGTGKTVTVVEAVIQIYALQSNSRILVTAPSNSAADLIATKLLASGCFVPGDFVRLLGFYRSERGRYSLEMKPFLRTAEDLDLVTKHRIIVATASTTGQFTQIHLNEGYFTHIFVDEAGYCSEPETLLPCILVGFNKGGQVILAGDPNQLGPVVSSKFARMCGLGVSFLERLMKLPLYRRDEKKFPDEKYNPLLVTKLVKNYRAHEMLLKVPSKLFYEDELEAFASRDIYNLSSDEKYLEANILQKLHVPLVFCGLQSFDSRYRGSTSWFNRYEAEIVVKYVKKLILIGVDVEDIGIITPYRGQVEKFRKLYNKAEGSEEYKGPHVGSVEEFQGGERKVIIYSTVRSLSRSSRTGARPNPKGKSANLQFILDPKRMNVSITRARCLLIVVGNPHVLATDKNWLEFLKYCVNVGAYTGCNLPLVLNNATKSVLQSIQNSNDNGEDLGDQSE